MHVLTVSPRAICIREALDKLSTKAEANRQNYKHRTALYEKMLRSGVHSIAPLVVKQGANGYLDVVDQDGTIKAYVAAAWRCGRMIRVASRKRLRPIPGECTPTKTPPTAGVVLPRHGCPLTGE